MADSFRNAMINRSLRDIKNNLEFLVESNVITSAQHDTIASQLPVSAENSSRALPAVPTAQLSSLAIKSEPTPPPEKKNTNIGYYADNTANAPPPAYPSVPATPAGPPVLAYASAMYQYNAQDAGDLALMPNDKVQVTEYMNNECYVRKEEKSVMPAYPPSAPAPSNYGNMPLDVASSAQAGPPAEPSKMEANGKKFGKKLGNAAIFGAGATIGGNIVNSIF
ncbi:unnamed protein product [Alternaria alternata]